MSATLTIADIDEQIAELRLELERLGTHSAADDQALADAEVILAQEQAVYDAAGAAVAAAQAALNQSYGHHSERRDPHAEQALRAAEAAFQAARDDLGPALISRNEASRRRSGRRGQARYVQGRIAELERERERLMAQAAAPSPGRDLLSKIRERVLGGAA